MKRAMDLSAIRTWGYIRFQRTGVASCGICLVLRLLCFVLHPREMQWLISGADVEIMCSVVGELGGSIVGPLMLPVRQGNISADALVLGGLDVLDGSIFGVASHLMRVQFPAEAHAPEQIEHGSSSSTHSLMVIDSTVILRSRVYT